VEFGEGEGKIPLGKQRLKEYAKEMMQEYYRK